MTDIKSRLIDKSKAWDGAQTSWQKEYDKAKAEAAAYIERLEAALRFISDNPGAHPANLAQYARNTIKGGNDE